MSTSIKTPSSTAKLGEYLAKLLACKADGTNWVFFRDRFMFAIDAAGLSDHFEDAVTSAEPVIPVFADPQQLTADENKVHDAYTARWRFWRSEQAVIKQGLATVIPDSLFRKIKSEKTAKSMWDKVKREYEHNYRWSPLICAANCKMSGAQMEVT
ncbi:hypothetical protein GGX14DRAFT_520401 [Mycena pura]|uniref:Uncharacterized protein n=1 Tax=Mycena pura TaxID=153505 RepID=A0AAD6YHI7_9AGAR|nr:hypothetical protein GGX14DRAFT_520401 [Mycena pura]